MKKLNFIHSAQKLTKEQMKNVVGGVDPTGYACATCGINQESPIWFLVNDCSAGSLGCTSDSSNWQCTYVSDQDDCETD